MFTTIPGVKIRGDRQTALESAAIRAYLGTETTDQEMVKNDLYFLAWVTGRIVVLFIINTTGI